MEYMCDRPTSGPGMILCCQCGTQIEPNPANMCVACLRSEVDITEGIPKQASLFFCRNCERYLQPPNLWVKASLESRELLSVCLKRIKGLNKLVRLVDAGFIWTEPHSKRIKVKLTIQKEVMNGALLQQVFVVEFVVHNQMCDGCHRVEAKDFWRACVQIRQKTTHRKTLFYLEQMILKYKAHVNTSSITQVTDGLDFFYGQKQDARKMMEFLQSIVPCRYKTGEELVSHDPKCNVFNYKHTYSVEIVPICKDEVVCLPPKLAQHLGNIGQLCVVYRVTQAIHIIDPNTCQIAEVPGPIFWRSPFNAVCGRNQMTEFIVMEIEIISDKDKRHVAGRGTVSQKHVLAGVWVVKASELGVTDQQFHCHTYLGHLLRPGDTVLGFDMRAANVNDAYVDKIRADRLPDVILIKKMYTDSTKRARKRKWQLKHLDEGAQATMETRDYNEFLEDLEEDVEYRQNINIYKDPSKLAVDTDDTDDEDAPKISLAEMLDDLHIAEDATGGEGADMMGEGADMME
ncbi:hypothetical protein NP493_1077g00019 [Ridgeia piscesae]|uniref:60S ribosomal export protein NMD3 n=1 Tax=Ridgeia piscesae TaxID=27915 RepID=A0AAD9KIV1_RIDPI|nr:hypothetical protein NP493_1077g00019 [Ridgeia piscesae]